MKVERSSLCERRFFSFQVIGVARSTLQTPKLWSVSRPIVTLVTLACASSHYFPVFFLRFLSFFLFFVAEMLMEIGFCGNSLGLIMGEMCWDGIEQRGTWHETDGVYLWMLVVWTLDPVASETMLLTDTCTL